MSLGRIIREKRQQLNLTLDEVSDAVGFSKPYLSTIETAKVKNPPSDELLTKLEKILKFERGLLVHIAHMEKMPTDVRRQYESAEAENLRWRHFAKNLVNDKAGGKKIGSLLAKNKLNTKKDASFAAACLVPVINKVSAGYPTDFDDLDYPAGIADDYIRCPDMHDPNSFAVRVVGDSMEPKYREGDIVVFSPAEDVRSGDDCFIRFVMPHETAFKRVFFETNNRLRIQPRNEKYPPLIIDGKRINGLYKAVARYEKL
jgi:repressor LexA